MSRYEDGYPPRGRTADYYTTSSGGAAPPAYPHVASPGYSTYDGKPQARLTYEPQETNYPPRSASAGLHVTESRSRPRSVAAPSEPPRERGDNKYGDSDDSDDGRVRSPIEKAKRLVGNTFTDSTTGLGVGVLGALVGGLAAREAVDLTSNNRPRKHKQDEEQHKRNQLIGAVVGAAVGALGANAVEKRIEVRRARDELAQEKWERKWRRPEGADPEVLEKMEIIARPRSRSRSRSRGFSRGSHGRSRSRRGVEREVDPGAHSWRSVEDWLLDEGDDGRPRSGRQRSRDGYRY